MASAAPTFPSTRETTNYARLCRLLVDFGSQALRERFDIIHPPGGLETVLATPPAVPKLQSLQKKKILNPSQWDILYPAIESSVSSKNFDITLLMVLLRNICGLNPPATGWDAFPSPTDLSCEADIASNSTEIKCVVIPPKRWLTMRHFTIIGRISSTRQRVPQVYFAELVQAA